MKTALLICESMGQEPLESLGDRTPLEVAKTPAMDSLAQKGRVGRVELVPRALSRPEPFLTRDVACMAALGYDPLEFYTGLAPLEAVAKSVTLDDRDVIFRCDFVTASEEVLTDARAGNIRPKEANVLLQAVAHSLGERNIRFIPGDGFANYCVIRDAELFDDLDDADCLPPSLGLGRRLDACLPRGRAGDLLARLMKKAERVLEGHEINRVRVDLGENPANRLWLWGQGRLPKLPSFGQRHGLEGTLRSQAIFAQGLAIATGLGEKPSAAELDFECVYFGGPEDIGEPFDARRNIKILEEFDSKIVKMTIQKLGSVGEFRICVVSAQPSEAIYFLSGHGIEPCGATAFDEKNCSGTGLMIRPGQTLIEGLLS